MGALNFYTVDQVYVDELQAIEGAECAVREAQ